MTLYTPEAAQIWTAPSGTQLRMRVARVGIDDLFGIPLDAFILADERWNGFVIPYFTREQADVWLERQRLIEGSPDRYDAERDCYIVEDGEGGELEFEGGDWINPNGQTVRLYCIGGWHWTWTEWN